MSISLAVASAFLSRRAHSHSSDAPGTRQAVAAEAARRVACPVEEYGSGGLGPSAEPRRANLMNTTWRRLRELDRQLVDLRCGVTGFVVHPESRFLRRPG
jgi:hypothetical protein